MKTIACAMLILCMAACSDSDDFKTGGQTQRHAAAAEKAFDFDVQEFANAFNRAARLHGFAFRIDRIEIRHGAIHDYFRQTFDAGVSLTAGISKESGRVTSVTALIDGNADAADRARLLALAEIVMSATNPHMSQRQAVATASAMLDEAVATADAHIFPQRFIDHVRYGLRNDRGVGTWWIANPA